MDHESSYGSFSRRTHPTSNIPTGRKQRENTLTSLSLVLPASRGVTPLRQICLKAWGHGSQFASMRHWQKSASWGPEETEQEKGSDGSWRTNRSRQSLQLLSYPPNPFLITNLLMSMFVRGNCCVLCRHGTIEIEAQTKHTHKWMQIKPSVCTRYYLKHYKCIKPFTPHSNSMR